MSNQATNDPAQSPEFIPVMIITGFLGAGKTTFLAKILKQQEMANSAVIINEFGEFGLDHLLVEYVPNQTFELTNGCLCCSQRGELVEKMLDLYARKNQGQLDFKRILIETSGIADTASLIENLWNDPQIRQKFQLSKVITLISALEWDNSQSAYDEVNSQLAISDNIIVSKSDLLTQKTRDKQLAHLQAGIELVNPTAECFFSPLSPEQLRQIIDPAAKMHSRNDPRVGSAENRVHNTARYQTCTLTHNLPLPQKTMEFFMDILLHRHGKNLLRVKGLVLTSEKPDQPLVIQAVKSILSPEIWLTQWTENAQTRLTLIHQENSNGVFIDLFNSILDIPAVDRPDKAALSDNPLSITGVGKFELK